MEEFQLINPPILAAILSLILFWSITRGFLNPRSKTKLPPSPLKLPIIGNLHQLSSPPHRSLHSLARKHGPLMLLRFGRVPVLIVSSADLAQQIMQTHDLIFASRPSFKVYQKLHYGCKDVASAPYGEYWRKMKCILILRLLSRKMVRTCRSIIEEETSLFLRKIQESSGAVNLTAMFTQFSFDAICRSAFGAKYSDSDNGKKFLLLVTDFMELAGVIEIGEFIPWLSWISCVNGFEKRVGFIAKAMDEVYEGVIQERLQNQQEEKSGNSFVDILLDDVSLDRDSIKGIMLDVFTGGTDTISTTLEWAMTELLRHPAVMEKLQREVRGIVKQKHHITYDDLEKMHYLKLVIKEILRCHPPFPLLVPRVATEDVQIKGFDVAAGTIVMINAWAIAKDPLSWDEPEKFIPERFLNSSRDFKGLDFEFTPFGAGRRICPGITYAVGAVELMLANLVQKFDWELADGMRREDLDMRERAGLTAHRVVPLHAVASNCK